MDVTALREKLINERDLDIGLLEPGTVENALGQRMGKAGTADIGAYVDYLDANPDEYQSLLEELVSPPEGFFGDDALTSLVQSQLIPSLLSRRKPGDRIRVWVPHCGKGHLVFDLALLLSEQLGDEIDLYDARVMGTDESEGMVDSARLLRRTAAGYAEVRGQRLRRQASTHARKITVFGVYDLIGQPPYSRMDLIICRAYLPLLNREERARVIGKLIHGLAVGGTLVLGRGEIAGFDAEAPTSDRPFSLFTKKIARPGELKPPVPAAEPVLVQYTSAFDRLHVPVLLVNTQQQVTEANAAANAALASEGGLTERYLSELQPRGLFTQIAAAVTAARRSGEVTPVEATEGWTGAAAPILGRVGSGQVAVTLLPTPWCPHLPPGETEPCDVRDLAAMQSAEIGADLWAQNREVQLLRTQASLITERLYSRTEELSRIRDELASRNTELQITNQELRQAIVERERAESVVRQAFEREHRIAGTLQEALLPPAEERVDGLVVAAKYQAAFAEAEVGGDFYSVIRLSDSRWFAALGDVSGKGLEAAVFAYMAKYMKLGFATEDPSPDTMLVRLNDALCAHSPTGWFVTLIYMLFDLREHKVYYGNAGHEPSIFYSAREARTTLLPPTGRALGLLPGAAYTVREIDMQPGDMIVSYTDGISEAGYMTKPLGTDGVAGVVIQHADKQPAKILEILHETAIVVAGGKLTDDAASVLIKREY